LSLKSHVYADFELVVNTTTNPSPTTILDFRRPLDGFFIAPERKSVCFKSRTYTNKMVVGFFMVHIWYTNGTQNPLPTEV